MKGRLLTIIFALIWMIFSIKCSDSNTRPSKMKTESVNKANKKPDDKMKTAQHTEKEEVDSLSDNIDFEGLDENNLKTEESLKEEVIAEEPKEMEASGNHDLTSENQEDMMDSDEDMEEDMMEEEEEFMAMEDDSMDDDDYMEEEEKLVANNEGDLMDEKEGLMGGKDNENNLKTEESLGEEVIAEGSKETEDFQDEDLISENQEDMEEDMMDSDEEFIEEKDDLMEEEEDLTATDDDLMEEEDDNAKDDEGGFIDEEDIVNSNEIDPFELDNPNEDFRSNDNVEKKTPKLKYESYSYFIKKGDSLSKIAKSYYGKYIYWKIIYEKNKDILGKNPNKIYPNQKIMIPKIDLSSNEGDIDLDSEDDQ